MDAVVKMIISIFCAFNKKKKEPQQQQQVQLMYAELLLHRSMHLTLNTKTNLKCNTRRDGEIGNDEDDVQKTVKTQR